MTRKNIEHILAEPSTQLNYSRGDFGAKIENGKLLLPEGVYQLVTNDGDCRDAASIASLFDTFPSHKRVIAEGLGWERQEVDAAYQKLFELIKPYITQKMSQLMAVKRPSRIGGYMVPEEYLGKTPGELKNT